MAERGLSVRLRATMLATGVVVAALAVAAVALVALTRNNLTQAAEDEAMTRARTIAQLAEEGAISSPLPGDISAQVIAADGKVIAATRDLGSAGSRIRPGYVTGRL